MADKTSIYTERLRSLAPLFNEHFRRFKDVYSDLVHMKIEAAEAERAAGSKPRWSKEISLLIRPASDYMDALEMLFRQSWVRQAGFVRPDPVRLKTTFSARQREQQDFIFYWRSKDRVCPAYIDVSLLPSAALPSSFYRLIPVVKWGMAWDEFNKWLMSDGLRDASVLHDRAMVWGSGGDGVFEFVEWMDGQTGDNGIIFKMTTAAGKPGREHTYRWETAGDEIRREVKKICRGLDGRAETIDRWWQAQRRGLIRVFGGSP